MQGRAIKSKPNIQKEASKPRNRAAHSHESGVTCDVAQCIFCDTEVPFIDDYSYLSKSRGLTAKYILLR